MFFDRINFERCLLEDAVSAKMFQERWTDREGIVRGYVVELKGLRGVVSI